MSKQPTPAPTDTVEICQKFQQSQDYALRITLMQRIRAQKTEALRAGLNCQKYPPFFRLWIEQELIERQRAEERGKRGKMAGARPGVDAADELLPPSEEVSILKARYVFAPQGNYPTGFVGKKYSYDMKQERIKFNETGPAIRELIEAHGASLLDEIIDGQPLRGWRNFIQLFNRMKAQGNLIQFTIYCNYWYEPTPHGLLPMMLFDWKK